MKRLSFDWNVPPHLAQARAQRTFVVLRLHPLGERTTRLTLHRTGWGEGGGWDQACVHFDKAWGGVLANLRQRPPRVAEVAPSLAPIPRLAA